MNTENLYKVYFHLHAAKPIEVRAASLYAAKQAGIAHFKPSRSKQHMVSAYLVERDGEQVTTTITS